MKKRDAIYYLWLFLVSLMIFFGLFVLILSMMPYSTLKVWGNAISKDGNLEILTPHLYSRMHLPGIGLGIGLLLAGSSLVIWGKWARTRLALWLKVSRRALESLKESGLVLLSDLRGAFPTKPDRWILALILAFAVFLRLVFINRGMEYDESYTFSEFARHSFWQVISDYHVPNNHVFHTILVHFSFLIFGNSPWAIRLPALLAGTALVPAVYFLATRIYSRPVGWMAAVGVAAMPVLVFYSVNARGYTFICLWTVLLLLLSDYVRRRRSPAAWALMVVVTALGFYTIPIMLYPFGIVVTWLFFSGVVHDISPDYRGLRGWLGFLIGYSFCAGLLTIFLYLPIFRANGILSVFAGNTVVNSLSVADFLNRLPIQVDQAIDEMREGGLAGWVFPFLLASSVLSFFFHRRDATHKLPLQAALLLFLVPLLAIQRPLILARVWLFLLPLLILWASAGLVGLAGSLRISSRWNYWLQRGTAVLALLFVFAGGINFVYPYLAHPDSPRYSNASDAQLVSLYFKDHLRQGDVIVVSNDADAQYWYYFEYDKIPETYIRTIKSRPFRHAYIIAPPNNRRTIESVISDFGPDLRFFKMATLKPVTQIRDTMIYEIWPYQDAVDRAYGVK